MERAFTLGWRRLESGKKAAIHFFWKTPPAGSAYENTPGARVLSEE
jgi:hypothetical protein